MCVSCGAYVPEGRMICPICEKEFDNKEDEYREYELLLEMCYESDATSV